MDKDFMNEINDIFAPKTSEGEDKVTSLENAIEEHVKPGMNLYLTPEGNGAMFQLARQFWGTKPDFTLSVVGVTEQALNLVYCGMVKKLITSNCSHGYPSPGLSNIIRDAYKNKTIEIENWTLHTHIQMLMAGAMGVGFLPTHSVTGSSMEQENRDSFLVIDDPFKDEGKIGLIKALNPDVAIVHACAADRYGNAIGLRISPQAQTDHKMWGAKASKNGVIVTTERIVSTDVIREHAAWVTLPGYLVKAVCHVPFGAHPQGMFNTIPGLFDSYAPDYEFSVEHREACQNYSELDSWIQDWVLDCRNQEEFIKKLGAKRIERLQEKAEKDYWKKDYQHSIDALANNPNPNETEIMILTTAQKIMELVLENNYKVVLGGVGASMLSSWIAYYFLKERQYDLDLIVGSGTYGFAPRPGDQFFGSFNHLPTCKAFLDTPDMYGFVIPGQNNRSMSILGAAQIDKCGNINSTRMKDTFLIGSGGANDAANASEVLVVAKQSKRRFVDAVPYITCPGKNIKTLVSDMGVFQKIDGEEEFTLVACLPDTKGMALEEKIRRIKESCGWNVRVAGEVKEYPLPGMKELTMLRLFDPERFVLGE